METFLSFISNHSEPWESMRQPISLVNIDSQIETNNGNSSSSTRNIATGISAQANTLLSQLNAPLYIVAFTGFGRTGKSATASALKQHLTKNQPIVIDEKTGEVLSEFVSQAGNFPCTNGIDMMVFKHPSKEGHFIFLDCEGGGNHNQSALPFVIGLAARLSSHLYVFERGCFTTNGLDTVMQIINMGGATGGHSKKKVDITRNLTLVENMSINQSIPPSTLKSDLLTITPKADDQVNQVRNLINKKFDIDFISLPFNIPTNIDQNILHQTAISQMASSMEQDVVPFQLGGADVDGPAVLKLASELISQIRSGGKQYNMVTATEAMVSSMAVDATLAVWTDFIRRIRKAGLHPSQITGRKHLRTILREVEGVQNGCLNDLENFTLKLEPQKSAISGKELWKRNYLGFIEECKLAHKKKATDLAKYTIWAGRMNTLVTEIVGQSVAALGQMVRFARFSTGLVLMSNYYVWRKSLGLLTGFAKSSLSM